MRVELTEEMVNTAPPEMDDFRFYRIEYDGIERGRIWLPSKMPRQKIEQLFKECNSERL